MSENVMARIAVVTGSASGIGAATVDYLRAHDGDLDVIGWDLNGAPPVDVSSSESIQAAAAMLPNRIDHVVLAAGVSRMAPILETTDAEWDLQMRVNAFGVFACLRALVPKMAHGSSIAIVDSCGGLRAAPLLSAYCASKFAVSALVEVAAVEFASLGIRVNGVCPMYVRTPMQERELAWEATALGTTAQEVLADYERTTPLGRVAEPSEIASTIAFLLSDASRYMTGSLVTVSGGAHIGFTYRPNLEETENGGI
jgi:NAD(P)-dependent dehydrogenase (short-subunit alcohol dehydrogenase family)